ncbi:MAG: hypothetical protein QM750_14160 [Rubrivivax sp.]
MSPSTRTIRILAVLWPAFLATIVIEGLVFSMFDPSALRWTDGLGETLSPLAVYTLAFVVIWAAIAGAVALAGSFALPSASQR